MKAGANFLDRNKIAEMIKDGKSAKYISSTLGIKLGHIETYMPKKTVRKKSVKADVAG